jgi:hypothetical protein
MKLLQRLGYRKLKFNRKFLPRSIACGVAFEGFLAALWFAVGGVRGFNPIGILIALLHLPISPVFVLLPTVHGEAEPVAAYVVGSMLMATIWTLLVWIVFASLEDKKEQKQGVQNPGRGPAPLDPANGSRQILRVAPQYNKKSLMFGVLALLLQIVSTLPFGLWPEPPPFSLAPRTTPQWTVIFLVVGFSASTILWAKYAKAKGQNAAWGLLGLFCCLGWVVLQLLPDKTKTLEEPHSPSLR